MKFVSLPNGMMRVSPEHAAWLGVPEVVEPWHFNLMWASIAPKEYADVLGAVENWVLYDNLFSWQSILAQADRDITAFVSPNLQSEFAGMVERVKAIVIAEMTARGLSLPPDDDTPTIN